MVPSFRNSRMAIGTVTQVCLHLLEHNRALERSGRHGRHGYARTPEGRDATRRGSVPITRDLRPRTRALLST